ncbi:hypothetical protein HMPREF9371_0446 [Neisseria shayeganii 871]|uniref:Uncharacterized protein n=1 Tax=Neisseria shayeganii 871 TaxID=1032488 RepID=G4CFS1_9NEIS|nr:hypothetical protein HMPREF9371_0446 [Neisseria shayeganii 871]
MISPVDEWVALGAVKAGRIRRPFRLLLVLFRLAIFSLCSNSMFKKGYLKRLSLGRNLPARFQIARFTA